MSIFNETPDEKLQREAADLQQTAEAKAQDIILTFQRFSDFVWRHPMFTPQQVLDTFGPDAARLFALSNAVLNIVALYTGQVPDIVPRNYTYQINPDGTITLTYNPDTVNQVAAKNPI